MVDETDTPPAVAEPMDIRMHGDIGKLFAALAAAQQELGGGGVKKDAQNPHFRSTYATLAATVAVALPALSRHGISVLQPVTSQDSSLVRVTTILGHSSGAWLSGTLAARPQKSDPQGIGSCATYLRRYTLQGLAGLAPEDDDGNAASAPPRAPASAPPRAPASAPPRAPASAPKRASKPPPTTAPEPTDRIPASAPRASSPRSDAAKAFKAKYDCKKGPCEVCGYPVTAGQEAVWGQVKGVLDHAHCHLPTVAMPMGGSEEEDRPPPAEPDYRDDPDNEVPFAAVLHPLADNAPHTPGGRACR